MDAAALIAKMEAQRASWVDLPDGRKVRIVRPPELELVQLADGIRVEHAAKYATGWKGFTEATLFGAAQGSSDEELPFDRGVWAAYIADHLDEAKTVIEALSERVVGYLKQRADTAKN